MIETSLVHPTAIIEGGATIGAGTRIWHFSHVMASAVIGREVTLGQNVFVGDHVIVGNGCKVQNNVSIYEGVELEDYVFCGPSVVFTNVRSPRAAFPTPRDAYLRTVVRFGATIGANATIVCGTSIGRFAFIAAGATVTRDVPSHALMTGVPARRVGWACECGKTLTLTSGAGVCSSCRRAYTQVDDQTLEQVNQ